MLHPMRNLGLAVVLVAGCGKGSGPAVTGSVKMDSPRAVADGMMLAYKEHNPKLAGTLIVSDELLKKHLACPDDSLAKRVAARRAKLDAEFGQPPADTVIELAKFDKLGTKERQLRNGDEFEGCKAKGLIKSHSSRVELRLTKGGRTEFDDDSWLFAQLGEEPTWYWVP